MDWKPVQKNPLGRMRSAVAKRCSPAVGYRGAVILMAAAVAALASVAAVEKWESSERDVPVATDHGLVVSVSVPDVVYKTAPFQIVVVVNNSADRAVEITAYHGDDALHPAVSASILNGSDFNLLPVLPEGVAVQGGFMGKQRRHAYTVPARGGLSFRAEVDWRNYPDRIDRVHSGHYRLFVYFFYSLGDNTSPPPWKLDPATNELRADLSSIEAHSVRWILPTEIRDSET